MKYCKSKEWILTIDELEVHIIEKMHIKNINLNVKPNGDIVMSAPFGYPQESLRNFIKEKKSWIKRTQEKYLKSPLVNIEHISDTELNEMRVLVGSFTPALVEKWEQILGVKVQTLVYRKMTSRWGSCQPATG